MSTVHLDASNCVILNRDEAMAELDRAYKAFDRLALRQGLAGGALAASLAVGVWWLVFGDDRLLWLYCNISIAALVLALVWRIWNTDGIGVHLKGWSADGFAAALHEEFKRGEQDGQV